MKLVAASHYYSLTETIIYSCVALLMLSISISF